MYTVVDLIAIIYSGLEIILFFTDAQFDIRIKTLRIFAIIRLIRVFKHDSFTKGISVHAC
jgi:hypothetical protein